MNRKPRRWEAIGEEDPGAGLLNLLDVWVAFSVALLLALFSYLHSVPEPASAEASHPDQIPVAALQHAMKMPHYRPTRDSSTGEGTRLGVAYQLSSGEVVYVPEGKTGSPSKEGAGMR